jgi:multidrug transporter EmrE-like cation transporter
MTAPTTPRLRLSPDKLYPYLSACVVAAGLLFEIGYFTKAGPGYFPLFSFTDHLVIAVQTLPDVGAMVAAAVVTYALVLGVGCRLYGLATGKTADEKWFERASLILTIVVIVAVALWALALDQLPLKMAFASWAGLTAALALCMTLGPRDYILPIRLTAFLVILAYYFFFRIGVLPEQWRHLQNTKASANRIAQQQ